MNIFYSAVWTFIYLIEIWNLSNTKEILSTNDIFSANDILIYLNILLISRQKSFHISFIYFSAQVLIFTLLALSLAEEYQQAKIGIFPANIFATVGRYIPPSQRVRDWQTYQPTKAPITWFPQVQNDYGDNSMSAPQQAPVTTTPVPVIKNEYYMGDNGDYKYE